MLTNSVFARHELEIHSEQSAILKRWDSAYPSVQSKKASGLASIVDKLAAQGARSFHSLKSSRWHWDENAKKLFILIKEKDGVFRLVRIDCLVGAGGYGTVYKVKSMFDQEDLALKVSVSREGYLENNALKEELRIYEQLYPQQPMGAHHTGIQMNCLQILLSLPKFLWQANFRHIQLFPHLPGTTKRRKCFGIVMPFYPFGVIEDKFKLTQFPTGTSELLLRKQIEGIYQILLGQARFESHNMAHLDISIRNCFLATSDTAEHLQIDLCDLGGVVDFSGEIRRFIIRRIYTYKDEFEKIEEYQKDGKRRLLIPYIIKNATFQSALAIYWFLSKGSTLPYHLFPMNEWSTGDPKTLRSFSKDHDWLHKMFDPDMKKRPSPKQALLNFHEYISLAYGKTSPGYQKYNDEVQKLTSQNDLDKLTGLLSEKKADL
ncbi:MAG TPA: hypothetical protein VLG76_02065 [Rhabdochlamydiaceae bacterium]|nr:hypothetical protein [Rhabdochlamydiaceae bacterium]